MYPTETEIDNVSDLSVITAPAVDEGYESWLDDVERNRQAELDAEMDAMHAAAAADGVDAAPFHDLTPEKRAELMAFFPSGYGWMAFVGYRAGAEKPFFAELRRPTPAGPDVARVGEFTFAESALRSAVMFANGMLLAQLEGTDADKAAVRERITYAKR